MSISIPYKSFCWNYGTTSFRTKDFNKNIELQLSLLDEFWSINDNQYLLWNGNAQLQESYYDFLHSKEFLVGSASNKAKDAREKTSGLVDIGLVHDNRYLSEAGVALLEISKSNDFITDNLFQISKDSFIYLKQLLKMHNTINGDYVRPFIVMLYLLSKLEYLTTDEFTYLLPLCTNEKYTYQIINGINSLRNKTTTIDTVIITRLMEMESYIAALTLLKNNTVDENIICEIGLNRKSRKYDKAYFPLYKNLHALYLDNKNAAILKIYNATKKLNLGRWWRRYLFNTTSAIQLKQYPSSCLNSTIFDAVSTEAEFKTAFFKIMHLFKAKATLLDYYDLNRRYINTTDIVMFEDSTVKLDIVPKHFFGSLADKLYAHAYTPSDNLFANINLDEISPILALDENVVIEGVNTELGTTITTIAEARQILEDKRYEHFHHLLETKFTDENILALLDFFENRNDSEIRRMVTDNADIPTIFEYILGILWYKASERQGKILHYMKLSLDADLLPKTHAVGGQADIVYEYNQSDFYPAHSLLLEATLADSSNQRRMEMEPVSRHLGQHLIKNENPYSYCVFATNDLNINVVSDFRARKSIMFYDTQNTSRSVPGMKIIPLQVSELKKIVSHNKTYKELYSVFEDAFTSNLLPHEWYEPMIAAKLT